MKTVYLCSSTIDYTSVLIPVFDKLKEENIPTEKVLCYLNEKYHQEKVFLTSNPSSFPEGNRKVVIIPHGLADHLTHYNHPSLDYILVSGEFWIKEYKKRMDKFKGQIIPIGIPKADIYFNTTNLKEIIIKELGISFPYKKTILYPSGTITDPVNLALPELIRLSRKLKFNLIIKKKSDNSWYGEYIKYHTLTEKDKHIQWIVNYPNIYKLYPLADILIGGGTGTVREFYVTNRPSFQYIDPGVGEAHFPEANKIFIKDFEETIIEAFKDPDKFKASKKTILDFYYKLDGKSSERAVEVIKKALKELK